MSPVPKIPDLKPNAEEQHWFWVLIFFQTNHFTSSRESV